MPEPKQIDFKHTEVVTALLKMQGIHDGIWGLSIRFGFRGMNIGASENDLQPTALVPVVAIGLQQFDKINNLSVDASVANPREKAPKRAVSRRTARPKRRR